MSVEVTSERVICPRCGTASGKRFGNYYTSYAESYRGTGYIPICKKCVDEMFQSYLAQCHDVKAAIRQMCRKLDLYWNESLYEQAIAKNTTRTVMWQYISKTNSNANSNKSYDTTLFEEGTLWDFGVHDDENNDKDEASAEEEVSPEVVAFWGPGYSNDQYNNLEQRLHYWKSRLGIDDVESFDIGTETLIKQICALELDINRYRAAGKDVDKLITNLDKLIGSVGLKPGQKKQDDIDGELANTPLGVWLYRYETKRPLPEIDDDLKDVNGIRKYVFTWMGHLCKMLNLKNAYSQLYEDEIARLSVNKPEYDGDDEEFIFGADQPSEQGSVDDV